MYFITHQLQINKIYFIAGWIAKFYNQSFKINVLMNTVWCLSLFVEINIGLIIKIIERTLQMVF